MRNPVQYYSQVWTGKKEMRKYFIFDFLTQNADKILCPITHTHTHTIKHIYTHLHTLTNTVIHKQTKNIHAQKQTNNQSTKQTNVKTFPQFPR